MGRFRGACLLIVVVLLSGCVVRGAQTTIADLEAAYREAQDAIAHAETMGAKEHAPDLLNLAQQRIDTVRENQLAAPSSDVLRQYEYVKTLAQRATTKSIDNRVVRLKQTVQQQDETSQKLAEDAQIQDTVSDLQTEIKTLSNRLDNVEGLNDNVKANRKAIQEIRRKLRGDTVNLDALKQAVGRNTDNIRKLCSELQTMKESMKRSTQQRFKESRSTHSTLYDTSLSGLTAYWSFDNATGSTFIDETGQVSGRNLGAKFGAEGLYGSTAVEFSGDNDILKISDASGLDPGFHPGFTVSGWFKTTELQNRSTLISKWNSESEEGWHVSLSTNELEFTMKYGHDTLSVNTTGGYADGQWHHFVMSYNSTDTVTRLYMNGHQVDKVSGTTNVSTNVPLILGAFGKGKGGYFRGKLDELQIFTRSLSAEEVRSLTDISTDASKFCETLLASEATTTDTGLVAYWPMDDPGSIKDRIGQHDATVLGNVTRRSGILKSSLKFNGENSALKIPHHSTLNLSSPMSVSAWVYPEDRKNQQILTKGTLTNGSTASPYSLFLTDSDLVFSLNTNDGFTQLRSVGYELERWHYLVGTYDGETIDFYLDGRKISTLDIRGKLNQNTLPVMIGTGRKGENYFDGRIDEIKLYDRELSTTEVKRFYRQRR
jgi:hypothetical protein